jgi:LPXTG-motif cell wall-anchored protein
MALATGVLAAAVFVLLALPASAHSTTITGDTVCFNGEHIVTWHIKNSSQTTNLLMTIVSVDAQIGSTTYPVTGYSSPVAKGATTDGTTTVPGGVTGTITATVHVNWPDGITDDDDASVTLQDNCVGTTTTTTTVPETTTTTTVPETTTTVAGTTTIATTTTTTVPETTTTTTVPETTTTVPETTTTEGPTTTVLGTTTIFTTTSAGPNPTTTTPISDLGSTVPTVVDQATTTTVAGSTELPRTGSSSGYPMFFGLSCLAGGALLLIRHRRNWIR